MNQSLQTRLHTFTGAPTTRLGQWQVLLSEQEKVSFEAVLPRQVHGGNIVAASAGQQDEVEADGVFVGEAQVVAGVRTADCASVVITSDSKALVLHVSRKTLVRGLLENATGYIDPRDIDHIFVGPHIGEYNFSFREEAVLLRRFREKFPRAVHFHQGMIYLSLRKALEQVFQAWEVHPDKIEFDGRDTYDFAQLPSYRRWLKNGQQGALKHLLTLVWRQ